MSNELQIFNNTDFGDVRVVNLDNEPWIVGRDAATALGYQNPTEALTDHVPAKFKKIITRKQWQQMASNQETSKTLFSESTMGGVQRVTLINEVGLYKLIMRSKLPNAEKFSDWCCGEVLPSIRKTGVYMTVDAAEKILYNPDFIIGLAQQVKDAQAKIAELQPKADYCEKVLQSPEAVNVTVIAKEYGMGGGMFNNLLHSLGIQYPSGKTWVLYQDYINKGYTITETVITKNGGTAMQMKWLQKGREFLYHKLKAVGILPLRERQEPMSELF